MAEHHDLNKRIDDTWKDLLGPSSLSDPAPLPDEPRPSGGGRPSHYQRLGGTKAVREAVDRLYLLIFNDDELVPYFEGKDLPSLKSHMASLLIKVLGGPDCSAGRDLAKAHQKLGITEEHFYRVADYVLNVLLNMEADGNLVTAVSLALARVKEQIVRPGDDAHAEESESDRGPKRVAATGEAATPGAYSNAECPTAPVDETEQRASGEDDGAVSSALDATPDASKGT